MATQHFAIPLHRDDLSVVIAGSVCRQNRKVSIQAKDSRYCWPSCRGYITCNSSWRDQHAILP
jgi:hypothetical protein